MGLLDDRDFDPQGFGGILGSLLYRGPSPSEGGLAQQARVAAATQLAPGIRGGNRTFDGDVFQTGRASFGLAGPGSLNLGPAAAMPDLSAFEPARPEPEEQGPMPDDAMMAQIARNGAAARLAQGVKSASRTNASPDFLDVAKSAGMGVANGAIGLAGLPAELSSGFGEMRDKYITNPILRTLGQPEISFDTPDPLDALKPAGLQKGIERFTGDFYQPRSRMGRYAETVGELAPLSLGGAAFGALRGGIAARGSIASGELWPAAKAGLDKLGRDLVTGAVVPGIAIEGLREAAPDSKLDSIVRYGYPAVRRGLPLAVAAKQYLSSQTPR